MFNRLALVAALLLAAGCSQNWDGRSTSDAATATAAADVAGASFADAQARVRSGRGFAGLPDRGDLVAYPARKVVREQGAFTWHQVGLSEAHALRAIGSGEMVVTAPDGAPIRLQYERHVEHPDGNWTWIGRDANGADAVVTFGDKAAFGTIPYRDEEPLRLTVAGGVSWLVATDRRQRGAVDGLARRTGADYVIPPELVAAAGERITSAAMQAESADATGTPTVDVALGYTNGFATSLGGASQAVTRLNNLVEITNQSFSNSQMAARIRLVHTVQVNYADATSNESALHRLTGYGGGVSQPDPAFAALRAARDQYGADLVSLVRKFHAPENDGCGIAWLIGGGQQTVETNDAPFGYSVVSDGTDIDEGDGKNYGCRQETLAHELGHNMGQAHNTEDTTSAGAHSYAYGYREASPTGFYTVMAYRLADSQQTSARYFSSPNVTYLGRPTGTATADNVRSLNLTMPIIATFRAAVVANPPTGARALGDVDADGKADVTWFNGSTGGFYHYLMDGGTLRGGVTGANVGNGYNAEAVADFNGDGRADILYSNDLEVRMLVATATTGTFNNLLVAARPALPWKVGGAGDLDADGKADIVWHNPRTGEVAQWIMNGAALMTTRSGTFVALGQTPRAIGDFSGDGRADVLFSNNVQVRMLVATAAGGFTDTAVANHPGVWLAGGAGDVTGDGKADMVWHNGLTGEVYIWEMNGAVVTNGRGGAFVPLGQTIRAVADYNGDGRADVLLSDNLQLRMLLANSSGFTATAVGGGTHPAGWAIVANRPAKVEVPAPGDVDADGRSDVVLTHPTGSVQYWIMQGAVRASTGTTSMAATFGSRALADFTGDGRADVLISDGAQVRMLVGGAAGFTNVAVAAQPAGWTIAGTGDVNADTKFDVIWHNPATGEVYYWLMDGTTVLSGHGGAFGGAGFTTRAIADFTGDGRADIVLSNGAQMKMLVATSAGTFYSATMDAYTANWNIVGGADIDADGKADLVWYHPGTSQVYIWLMDGPLTRQGRTGPTIGVGTTIRSMSDFDGDGRADLLVSNDGQVSVHLGTRTGGFNLFSVAAHPSGWTIMPAD